MSEVHCFSPDCSSVPMIFCDCSDAFTFLCEDHSALHSESEGVHHFSELFTKVNEESRNSAIETVFYLETEIEKYRSTILQESSSLIAQIQQVTENALNNLKKCDDQLKEYMLIISQITEINNSKPSGLAESLLKIKPEDMLKIRNEKLPKFQLNKISSTEVEELFRLENLEKIHQGFSLKPASNKSNLPMKTNIIKFVWSSSTTKISHYDVEKQIAYQVQLCNISGDLDLDQYGSKCLLPDGSLFYYGNGAYCVISPSNEVTEIPKQVKCQNGCSVYSDGFVYILGGCRKPPCSEKYNLSTSEWTSLAPFPIDGLYSSCALYKNFIFIGGRNSPTAVYYDISNNSYSEIPLTLGVMTCKMFLIRKESIFLLDFSREIYECKGDFSSWTYVGSCEIVEANSPAIGYSVHYKGKMYFLNYYMIYAFDLGSKTVERVKSILDFPKWS